MERFFCDCGTEVFFDNNHCGVCGKALGFDPERQQLLALQPHSDTRWFSAATRKYYQPCSLRQDIACNWLISAPEDSQQCLSCRLTRTIPTLALPRNVTRWQRLEQTKRRALYMVLRLGLSLNLAAIRPNSITENTAEFPPLLFDFLEDQRSNPEVPHEFVYSGHNNGVITLNAAEADDSFLVANRELMNEIYRTLLGHFRHELGHYYGLLLLADTESANEFRQLFGDERLDYNLALEHYYTNGPEDNWREHYISAYASSHPLEDWAESWAHYLHINDTLETAAAYKAIIKETGDMSFTQTLMEWAKLTVALNALNRSMGVEDAYPFIITPAIADKLHFIDRLVTAWRASGHNAATP